MWRQGGISGCKHWNLESLSDIRAHLNLKKMKEDKIVQLKLGFRNRIQTFEDLLNQYAREGWVYKEMPPGWNSVVLERDKNR